jgi:hypothetical protein
MSQHAPRDQGGQRSPLERRRQTSHMRTCEPLQSLHLAFSRPCGQRPPPPSLPAARAAAPCLGADTVGPSPPPSRQAQPLSGWRQGTPERARAKKLELHSMSNHLKLPGRHPSPGGHTLEAR